MTDPIADMLTQIKNAFSVKKSEVILPYSKFKKSLADLLQRNGLLEEVFEVEKNGKPQLGMKLRYMDGRSVMTDVKRVSRPGQRIYLSATHIPKTQSGYGVTVVSTSKGLMTDVEARKSNMGGEVICQIW